MGAWKRLREMILEVCAARAHFRHLECVANFSSVLMCVMRSGSTHGGPAGALDLEWSLCIRSSGGLRQQLVEKV